MRTFLVSLAVLLSVANVPSVVASPEGQMNFALQVSLAPVWFDPAETTSTSVPFIVLYAVHDALVKPMPGQPMAPSLAESWTVAGVELVLEANEQYWRKTPTVRTLVFRAVPDSSTRLAMLKRGEADVAFTFRGVLAEEVRRTPGLTLKAVSASVTEWLYFAEQWDPKSPWADRRVRLAANLAIDRQGLNEAERPGLSRVTASSAPRRFALS